MNSLIHEFAMLMDQAGIQDQMGSFSREIERKREQLVMLGRETR